MNSSNQPIQLVMCSLILAILTLTAAADDKTLPDPDGKSADMTKPVQVFILLGQSNMLGFGRVGPVDNQGTLEHMTQKKGKYPHLVDAEGKWTERKDVRYVHVMDKRGVDYREMDEFADIKNQWLTVKGNFGPELGFGHIMGHLHDEPVLVLKACIGNRSLGWDLLPPGSQRYEFEGKTYAGYKDNPGSWVEGQLKKQVKWYAGRQYDADTSHAKAVLKNLEKYYPGYKGQGYEIAGFVFWQGHKDQNPAHASRYEQNLVNFIKTLRKDFAAPDAKFVLATIAFGGKELKGHAQTICEAQLAVDGGQGKYPEFKGNVKAIDARPFWRDRQVSPSGQGHHYNHNAETYMEVGNALGWAMAELLDGSKDSSSNPPNRLALARVAGFAGPTVASSPQEAAAKGLLKVFILAGQSNMEGAGVIKMDPQRNGGKGSLEYYFKNEQNRQRFMHVVDSDGDWVVRDDVWIWYFDRKGRLTAGFGARETTIGPEFGFGHRVGEALDDQVLLIKIAWGGKSLAQDFRPPSSGGEVGPYYTEMLLHVKNVLGDIRTHFPDYDGRGYELVGFGWHQGWNDRVNQANNDAYEENMANFIRDVRQELGVKDLPFVIAETGMSGHEEKHPRALSLMRAQAAVAEYEEFKGNVAFVGTKDFYRPIEESPSRQSYHWNSNAETYLLIGDAMAKSMLELLEESKPNASK